MAKRVGSSKKPSKTPSSKKQVPVKLRKTKRPKVQPQAIESEKRLTRLIELIDFCTAGKAVADGLGETFLSYLLAMAIQEARSNLRHVTTVTEGPMVPALHD